MTVDPADIRTSVLNFFVIGIMAVVFIVLGKMLTTKYHVRGLSEIFQSV